MAGAWKITLRGDAAFGLLREGRKQSWKRKNTYYKQRGMSAAGEKQPLLDRTSQKMVFSRKTKVLLQPAS